MLAMPGLPHTGAAKTLPFRGDVTRPSIDAEDDFTQFELAASFGV
jgi:hypothetical protein